MRTFNGGPGMHGGLSLEVTSDGGFIGTGQHGDAAGICDLYAYKVDACGDPQWYHLFPSPNNAGGRCVKQTPDGGYIIAGLSYFGDGNYDVWLLKLDASGNLMWNKTFGTTGDDYGLYVNFTSDGGYIVTGFLTGPIGVQNVVLIKTDANGNMQWIKSYGGTGTDWGNYVAQTADGGYIVTGYTTSFGAGGADVYMIKTDVNGNLLWTKTFGSPYDDSPPWGTLARITPQGGYIVCSHTSDTAYTAGGYDMWVFETDSNGNLLWSKTYGGPGTESARYIEPTHDGGWVVCGFTDSWGAGLDDGYLIKIDSVGDLLWSKTYGSDSIEYAECVKATPDGGYSVSMFTFGFGATYVDPVFLKTDSAGFVGCNDYTASTLVHDFPCTVGTGGTMVVPTVVLTSPTVAMGTYTPVDTYLCFRCAFQPEFVVQDSIGCPGTPISFLNTTNIAMRCAESWQVNGTTTGGTDTLSYTFPTAGYYTISLLGQCGHNTDTMRAQIHIIPDPTPDFSFTNRCQDTAITFTDSSSAYVSTQLVQWKWNFGDGDSLVSTTDVNPVHQYAASGTYEVMLTVTDRIGCNSSITKAVTAYAVPVAGFSFSNVCNFNNVQFTDTTSIASGSVIGYLWSFGDAGSSTLQSPAHLYAGPGQYAVTETVVSNNGCFAAANRPVTVYPVPVAGFSVPNSCLGVTSQFTNTSTITSGTITYSWDFGDGNTSQLAGPSNLYAAAGTYTVKLLVTSNNGCADSVSQTVIIYPTPAPAFSFIDTCAGMSFGFTNTSTVSSGNIASQLWNFGDGGTSTVISPSHVYQQPGTYNVQLTVYSNQQCVDSLTQQLITFPNPVSSFTFVNACNGYANVFTNTSTVVTGAITASGWSFGDGNVSDTTSPAYTYAAPGMYNVQLVSVSDKGCLDTVQHQVQVYVQPVANFGASTVCVGNNTMFTDSTTPAGQATIWQWSFGDDASAAVQNPKHVYALAGNYNVQLIVLTANSCTDTAAMQITVLGKDTAQFNAANVCLNDTNVFVNITSLTYPDSTWLWNFGDGSPVNTQMSPSYRYAATGTYQVTLIAGFTDGCFDSVSHPVTVYVLPTVSANIKEVSCYLGNDGDILLTPVTGKTPLSYMWSNSVQSNNDPSLTQGNYSVVFTDANQCTASASYVITQPTLLVADTVVRPIICFDANNGSVVIPVTGGTPPYSFAWSNGMNTDSLMQLAPGTYTVTVTDAMGCTVTESATFVQPPQYLVLMDSDVTINLGENIQLTPQVINGNPVSWQWTPAEYLTCYTCQSPIAAPFVTANFTVQTVSDQGCDADKSVTVNVIPVYNIYVPNAFTPNGDGANDYFEVFGNKSAWNQFSVQVFDRIGELVYQSNDMNFKWDGTFKGKPVPQGVLIYEMYVVFSDGHSDQMYKGSITLLR